MQSGITASQDLVKAFNDLVSDSSQRGLLASISNETLVPGAVLQSQSSAFKSDLSLLQSLLEPKVAAYILLKTHPDEPNGFVAVTYVPDAAPVRQKMLFASTRLTLVRELGVERFRETIFVTTKEELTQEGWERHAKHTQLSAPLTEEEQSLQGIRDAEAEESRGTGARKRHVASGFALNLEEGLLEALQSLAEGADGTLVLVKIDISSEKLQLDSTTADVSPAQLSSIVPASEPRYTFYKYPSLSKVVFIYTCPTASKIKERMIYASVRARVVSVAETEAGLVIAKKLEGSSPDEFSGEVLAAEFEQKKEESKGFARPKRPGRK